MLWTKIENSEEIHQLVVLILIVLSVSVAESKIENTTKRKIESKNIHIYVTAESF
jgi:hypothetical protein